MSKIIRYGIGILMGVMGTLAYHFDHTKELIQKEQEKKKKLAVVSFRVGCLIAYPMLTRNGNIHPAFVDACRIESDDFEKDLDKIERRIK